MKAGSIKELISERSISGGSESESETSSTRGFILKVTGDDECLSRGLSLEGKRDGGGDDYEVLYTVIARPHGINWKS